MLSVRNGTEKYSSNSVTTRRNKEYQYGDQILLFLFMNAARLLCQKLYFIFAYTLTVTNSNKL